MKVLFLTSSVEDYLADSLLHGFRKLLGGDCVDYPKCEILYDNCSSEMLSQVRGNGFTLYSGLLEDIAIDRFRINHKVRTGFFDLVVISDVWRQYSWFLQMRPWLNRRNCIVFDGADAAAPYPAAGIWLRRPYGWLLPRAHREFLYFKREWTTDTRFSIWAKFLLPWMKAQIPFAKNLRTVSFSIPEEKLCTAVPEKNKSFTKHIVDTEVAERIPGSLTKYAFTDEESYFKDIQDSRFGITTKRSGWDCLRHYELAANGTVLCFRDLQKKPSTCAPHGLDSSNCLNYTTADELLTKTNELGEEEYRSLQSGAMQWAKSNTTVARANSVLACWSDSLGQDYAINR